MFFDINKVEIITCKIEWKVNNTSKLKELTNRDQFLTSTPFYSPKCPSVTWELRLYLNTSTAYNKSSFETVLGSGISLIQKGIPNNIILKVKHSIYSINVNFDCVDIIKSEISNFTNQTETPKYLIDLEKTVHSDDSIFLFCEVEFVPYNINCIDEITIDDFSIINTSQRPFSNMYKQGVLTDCVIKIGNERIHAHRCILANNSVVFQKMFEQKWMLEGQNGEINIVDTSPECYRAMIDYFYNGEIDNEILAKLAYELYAIAHKYEVKSLMDICEQMMALKIDTLQFTQNIFYLQFYNLPILEKACIKYIAENRKTFLESCEWKNIEQNYTDKAFYLLRSTLINEFD